jgi:hypothetical protein
MEDLKTSPPPLPIFDDKASELTLDLDVLESAPIPGDAGGSSRRDAWLTLLGGYVIFRSRLSLE